MPAILVIILSLVPAAVGAPSAEQALKLTPTQDGVDCDRPSPEEAAKCKIIAKKIDGHVGWVVETPEGVTLRKFLDTNGDNVVDQWSYYKDGVEVYRDIDSKFSGKADQFRWFHSGGSRWGLDSAGSGKLDAWRVISAEEVTAEIVAALVQRDAGRFQRVLLTAEELPLLGLGKVKADAVAAKIAKAAADFKALAQSQKAITAESKWLQFSGGRPGTVPAGTDGSTKDLQVYENVVAIVQNGQQHSQMPIGTLVQVGSVWKAIDAPSLGGDAQAEAAGGGFFFQALAANRALTAGAPPSDETQKGIAELEKLDPADPRRADVIERIAEQARTPEDRALWYRQLADTLSAAVQSGKSADGEKRLESLWEKVRQGSGDTNLAAYVRIRQLTAAYARGISAPKADPAKIQAEWLKSLEQYITDYPASPDAAEAMLQLGIAHEWAGQEDEAKKCYERIAHDFPGSSQAKKAAGAAMRLDSVGKPISLSGKGLTGGTIDLADYRGKVVLIQYWATWCTPAKNDLPALKQLAAKYGKDFTVLGVSLDTNPRELGSYLADNAVSWPQIFEEGGPESRLADALGIITVPTMILVDRQGRVVNRNIQTAEIEPELKKLVQ
jgi:thiol-disulfide isomerase/thioredoxin